MSMPRYFRLGLLFLALVVAGATAAERGFSSSVTPGLITRYVSLFGSGTTGRLRNWADFVRGAPERAMKPQRSVEEALLALVNAHFNRVPSGDDSRIWGQADYWATPAEFVSVNEGDCEDYAIAKYFALKELGIPVGRLRFVYVTTWYSPNPHVVLAYYPNPRADPLILDNLQGGIDLASDRPDLTPVFTFNDEDFVQLLRTSPWSSRQWRELMQRLDRELTY